MNQELAHYLNGHLAASELDLSLAAEIAAGIGKPDARMLFQELEKSFALDRKTLQELIVSIGAEESALTQFAGRLSSRLSALKLWWEGLKPGELGMFEALEMLANRLEGKLLLWKTLREISSGFAGWQSIDFDELERRAREQREGVEIWRMDAARDCLTGLN